MVLGHRLSTKDKKIFDLINNFNFGFEFIFYFFASLLVIALFCLFLNRALEKNKDKNNKSSTSEVKNLLSKYCYAILSVAINKNNFEASKIFFCFISIFLWYMILFITNSIKTNQVVVDGSDIVKGEYDIFTTTKVNCFLEKEVEFNMAMKALPGSFLYRFSIEIKTS